MNWDNLTKDELLSRFLQMEERIDELEEKLDQKDERIEEQNERIEEQQERIEELETRLRKYENPHTPPSKRRSGTDESPTEQDDEDDDVRTDGGTLVGKTVTIQSGVLQLLPTKKSRSPVTVVLSVANTSTSRWASAPTRRGDPGPATSRNHPVQPPLLPVSLLWDGDSCDTSDCPDEGSSG